MRLAQGGDGVAYRNLLEGISPRISGVIRCYVKDAAMAEDLHQEILLKIHKARHTYDPAKPFAPWLGSVTRNTIFDYLRRKRSDSRIEPFAEGAEFPSGEVPADEAVFLRDALARLSETHRSAIQLVHIEGLDMREAAARTGVGVDAMKARSHRAYKALEELLLSDGERGGI